MSNEERIDYIDRALNNKGNKKSKDRLSMVGRVNRFVKSNFNFKNKSFLAAVTLLAAGSALGTSMTISKIINKPEKRMVADSEKYMCDKIFSINLAMYNETPARHTGMAEYMPTNLLEELTVVEYWASVNAKLAGQENYNLVTFLDEAKMHRNNDNDFIVNFLVGINKMIEEASVKVKDKLQDKNPLESVSVITEKTNNIAYNMTNSVNKQENVELTKTNEKVANLYVDTEGAKHISTIIDDVENINIRDRFNNLRKDVSDGIVKVGHKIKP